MTPSRAVKDRKLLGNFPFISRTFEGRFKDNPYVLDADGNLFIDELLGAGITHAALEVAVGGRESNFVITQCALVNTQAGPATGVANYRTCRNQVTQVTGFHCIRVNAPGRRENEHARSFRDVFAPQGIGNNFDVIETPVGT